MYCFSWWVNYFIFYGYNKKEYVLYFSFKNIGLRCLSKENCLGVDSGGIEMLRGDERLS